MALKNIRELFPKELRQHFEEGIISLEHLQEIRLQIGQPVRLLSDGREYFINEEGRLQHHLSGVWRIKEQEMDQLLQHICRYSIYAFEEEMKQGFITVAGGHRIGLAGQVVLEADGKVRNLKQVRFMNIRISHEIVGISDALLPYLYENGSFQNTLLIAPPGCGKTTMLRDIIRQISDGNIYGKGQQVGVVDERSEIAGSYMGIPQNQIGMRTDVMDACPKVEGIMMLLRSMAPAVLAVDEIGSREDLQAILQAGQCGSRVVATMHGAAPADIRTRQADKAIALGEIFERFVFMERTNGTYRIKEIYGKDWVKCSSFLESSVS